MKLVFISNFMNHHQLPLAQRLYKALGDDYKFIALEGLPEERRSMGYADMNHLYPFVVCAYDSKEQMEYANRLALECDVLVAGSCPDSYIKRRTDLGKPVIKTSERFFKQADGFTDTVRHYLSAKKHLAPFSKKKLYFLCASAYTAEDVNRYTDFSGKTYKWGYFTEAKKYESVEKLIGWKHPASILWVARLIGWKHPELPVMIAKRLKDEGYTFELNMIGTGELEQEIRKLIGDNGLDDCVHMLGSMSPEQVREHMERAQIFMFTSDRNEGWGAVLNESMNSACAVVANRVIGSVPYLICDGENGLVYEDGNTEEIYRKVKLLLDDADTRERLSANAYRTIVNEWNPDTAAERLLTFAENIAAGADDASASKLGVCSRAEIIKTNL